MESDDIQRIRKYIEEKFLSSNLEMYPFPHIIIKDFFPKDVYEKILKFNLFEKNRGKDWISKSQMTGLKTETPYDHRKQINFHEEDEVEGSLEELSFWQGISTVFLGDGWFDLLVYKKFPTYFQLRFGDFFKEKNLGEFRKQLFLQRHDYGYSIGPHTDVPTRIFTCIFSFAYQNGFEKYGTQLLKHKNEKVRCWGNDHYNFEDFNLEKLAPYQPNNFLLFFKTTQSFHAVDEVDESVPKGRYGMQYQFYEKKGGTFKDLSGMNMYASKHLNFYGKVKSLIRRQKS